MPRYSVAVFVDGCFWHGCPSHGTRHFRGPTRHAGRARSRPIWRGTPGTPKPQERPDGPWYASGSRSGRTPGGLPSASPTLHAATSLSP
ncbi:hypothetical protein [Streptomyces albogriseolus]